MKKVMQEEYERRLTIRQNKDNPADTHLLNDPIASHHIKRDDRDTTLIVELVGKAADDMMIPTHHGPHLPFDLDEEQNYEEPDNVLVGESNTVYC